MVPIGTLWCLPRQRQSKVILSVAALNGLELNQVPVEFGVTNKTPEFVSKFTYGKVPIFEDSEDGRYWRVLRSHVTVLHTFSSSSLSGVGGESDLLGSNAKEAALIDQWIHFAEHEIGGPLLAILGFIYYGFSGPFTREGLDKQVERIVRALTYAESYLATRPSGYLVGNSVTLADLVLVGVAYGSASVSLGAAERAQYPSIFAHYAKVTEDERIKQYWGTADFVEVALTEPQTA
ncbi:glutathione S-transferase C-terminal-like protein [Melanogaster broomeanus]|nr:glutathione S-transferase C-terminal-like protein [Melanogaster broomeanus]